MSYNAANLSSGNHKLQATVTSNNGSSATSSVVNFTVSTDSTAPDEIENLGATWGGGSITFNWTNPTETDFKLVRIKVYTGPLYTKLYRTVEVTSPGTTATLAGLFGTFKFVFHTVDNSGNQSPGIERYYSPGGSP